MPSGEDTPMEDHARGDSGMVSSGNTGNDSNTAPSKGQS